MNNNTANLLMEHLLIDCKNLLKVIPNKQIIHVYQETNQYVDALAKLEVNCLSSFVVFLNPLLIMKRIIASDKPNTYRNRPVNF